MRILALITARGGSKRLPGKNTRLLGGRPLIVKSIEVAKGISEICDILVSTDDPVIAKIAVDAGAIVPWLRPPELATDAASSVDVALHALNAYEAEHGKVDGLMLLQPTSPFRGRDTVLHALECFRRDRKRPVVGFSPAQAHPLRCFRIEEDHLQPFVAGMEMPTRHQDLPPAYVVNGAIYLITPENLRAHRSFYSNDMVPLVIEDPREGLDIDTEWDWMVAELYEGMKHPNSK